MKRPTSFLGQLMGLRERQRQLALQSDVIGDDPLLSFYVKAMAKMLDCERCSIFIREPDTGQVWLKSGTALGTRDIIVDLDASLVGQVIRSGEPTIAENLDQKDGTHRAVDAKTGFRTRNILCIPVRTLDGTTVAGAVQVLNKQGGAAFDETDQAELLDSAHFLQLAIETAYVNQEATISLGRMTMIAMVSAAIAALLAIMFLMQMLGG